MNHFTRWIFSLALLCFGSPVFATLDISDRRAALDSSIQRDQLKYQMEYALAALQSGHYDEAKEHFDLVLSDIESLYSNNDDALKARSLWYEEGRKSFKGEPYERAMAYYYRGLLYLFDGDADNARASFLSGQLQDAFAEEDQDKTDFALLMLLEAWSAHMMHSAGLAEGALDDFQTLRSISVPSPDTHALVIVETGKSPRKLRDGISGEKLVYRRGKRFYDKYATVSTTGKEYAVDLYPVEDIYYQASTRGSRWVDSVNEGKAVYKEKVNSRGMTVANLANQLNIVNNLARDYGKALSDSGGTKISIHANVNFGAFALGASALSMIATKIKPKSDDRYWDNLPDNISVGFVPLDIAAEEESLAVSLYDMKGQLVHLDTVQLRTLDSGSIVAWYKFH
jgi:hypothetical protein